MLIVASSPDTIASAGGQTRDLIQALTKIRSKNNPVALISNHSEPDWFKTDFNDSNVQFINQRGRQDGRIISINAKKFGLQSHDCLVLASTLTDMQMGKNGGAVLIAAGWSNDRTVKELGIKVDSAEEFEQAFNLSSNWNGQWWFEAKFPFYNIKSLADLSKYGKTLTQQSFATKVTKAVKQGGSRLNALLIITARSLLIDGFGEMDKLIWGVYPSSSSNNDDQETLSDFTHRLRTTVSRVRYAKRGEPLFIRHTPSPKRSFGDDNNRTDPSSQIETIHLNPIYRDNIKGRDAVVIDDCTTYGTSFGVAAALLRKAGASSITGIALGKFGNQTRCYDITVNTDPFAPICSTDYKFDMRFNSGNTFKTIQGSLVDLVP